MKWYYAEGGRQVGPVEESVLDELVRQGTVRDDTLVWREGMAAWQRHAAARGASSPGPGNQAAAPAPPVAAAAGATRYCSECGRPFPASQLTSYGDVSVCAQCQPAYTQRLRGTGVAAGRRFGGFWIRFLARLIDGLILGTALGIIIIPAVLLTGGFGALIARNGPPDARAGALAGIFVLGIICAAILVPALYEIYFVSTRAATPGKLALGLKIIRAEGAPITTGLAVGRYCGYLVTSLIPLAIGFIMAGFDSEKRALHDYICGTRVVYAR